VLLVGLGVGLADLVGDEADVRFKHSDAVAAQSDLLLQLLVPVIVHLVHCLYLLLLLPSQLLRSGDLRLDLVHFFIPNFFIGSMARLFGKSGDLRAIIDVVLDVLEAEASAFLLSKFIVGFLVVLPAHTPQQYLLIKLQIIIPILYSSIDDQGARRLPQPLREKGNSHSD
jgi:hypothetical protein